MALTITKINSASTSVNYKYLESEHVLGISVSASYSFSIHETQFVDGNDNLLTGIEALKAAYGRKNIAAKIGLDEFKNGLITNLSFDESDRVRLGTASITIEENLKADNDGVMSQFFDNLPSQQDVESISDDLSFTRGEDSYSYDRSVSLRYKQDAGGEFLNKARLFLKNIYLGSRPSYGFQTDGISENGRFNLGLKPKVSEFIDELKKEIKFTENFESNRIRTFGTLPFSNKKTYSISKNEQGYTSKDYSSEVVALSEPLELNILSGIKFSLAEILAENTGAYGMPIGIEKTIKSDDGVASLSISFSNDPRQNSTNNIDYVARKSSEGAFNKYDFDFRINSRGKNHLVAFNNALTYFSGNRNIAYEKIPVLFSEITSGQLNEISRNVSFDPFGKSISESISFSSNPAYATGDNNILKREISVSDELQVGRNTVLPIYGDRELIIKNEVGKTLGSRSISVNVTSPDSDIELSALQLASGELPSANYFYLNSKRTSYNPLEGKCSANIDFQFFN